MSNDLACTPAAVAGLLARWALRSAADVVLDADFGAGAFLLASARRLQALGASNEHIASQLHGSSSHPGAAAILHRSFRDGGLSVNFPGIRPGSLLTCAPPSVDVLIGSTPAEPGLETEQLRRAVERLPEGAECSRLTDPQCLLLVHAAGFLKPGGRMAVLLSDDWLDMRFGTPFKEYLLRTFVVRGVLGFHKGAVPQARVRRVALLAEKRTGTSAEKPPVSFVCLRANTQGDLPSELDTLLRGPSPEASRASLPEEALKPKARWSPLLYAPDSYRALRLHPGMTSLDSLAYVRLGLQTFAKPFYVVSLEAMQRWQLERRWLLPLLLYPRQLDTPCLSADMRPRHYVLACRDDKEKLAGTRLLRYIEYWENQVLAPRGRGRPVVGVQNLPRIARTGRKPWYNLLGQLGRRGTAPILLPRRLYRKPRVVWNQAGWVAGENFIEVTPRAGILPQALLAVLNASVSEIALRVNANVYGGVYSLNPGSVGQVPVVDVRRLESAALQRVTGAYGQFLLGGGAERGRLDAAVFAAAGLPDTLFQDLQATVDDMQNPATGVPKPVRAQHGDLPEELRLL